jgi:hypothetical protein
MNKAFTIDLAYKTFIDMPGRSATTSSSASTHPQSLLDLPPGEARKSLLAVHDTLSTTLAAKSKLAIY